MTPLQMHISTWENCQRCHLKEGRTKVCHARGSLPCDILFCGESPGESEDSIGFPMVGPAGDLMSQAIKQAVPDRLKWCIINLTGCIPRLEDGDKASEPDMESIKTCSPRLKELALLADTNQDKTLGRLKLVVCVGRLAEKWLDKDWRGATKLHRDIPQLSLTHPAAIIRSPHALRDMAFRTMRVKLANAVEEFVLRK